MNKVFFSMESVERYTPPYLADASRRLLGDIDLDPASCALANGIIRARAYFTKDDDGISKEWHGRVFLNPPGGRDGAKSTQKQWWYKLASEYLAGNVTAAVYFGFNIGVLQTSQVDRPQGLPLPLHFPLCFPARRVPCLSPDGDKLEPGTSPPHPSVIVYLPNQNESAVGSFERFKDAFQHIGEVVRGAP